jgi:flagellar basal body-associated protein FliL
VTISDSFIRDVNSLKDAEQVLMKQRKIPLMILGLSSVFSIAASYAPTWMAGGVPLMAIAYLLLGGVFVSGFWFLSKMLWFDEQIPKAREILQAQTNPQQSLKPTGP